MIETPRYDLTMFKVHFGLLTLKAYTKGEHVLRFEAITHNTKQLRCGRILEKFPEITNRLAGMVERFCTALDCVDVGFLPDGTLDELPLPTWIGATRIGGVDVNKPRIRSALAAVLALSAAPGGFTVTDLTAKVHAITGQTDYTTRQAAYDLRKLRGKDCSPNPVDPGATTYYHQQPAPLPPFWPCATRSSAPSSPGSEAPGWAANPPTGPASTATTKPSGSTCKPSSTTSASLPPPEPPRHRQLFVDRGAASA
jgi:hypothetical protein